MALHREGRWLLTVRGQQADHAPNSIGLVGGHLESPTLVDSVGEPALLEPHILENNARREVAEETGMELTGVDWPTWTANCSAATADTRSSP